jgi:hypothetical protein
MVHLTVVTRFLLAPRPRSLPECQGEDKNGGLLCKGCTRNSFLAKPCAEIAALPGKFSEFHAGFAAVRIVSSSHGGSFLNKELQEKQHLHPGRLFQT